MYIRITKNQKGNAYYHLVESYREQGKVKQRTLLSLGRVEEGKLEQLAEAIGKHLDTMTAVEFAKHVDVSQTYLYGPLYLLQRMAESLGIENILKQIADKHERLTIDFYNIIFSLIASRFIRPMSKLGFYEHILDRLYPGIVSSDIDLQHIYRSMDLLSEHKEEIEQSLFFHQKDLFSMNVDVVLYDLTTLRFESTRVDQGELPRFGYSKEMRSDCTQLVFGLLTDTDGIPLGFEAFPGNTFEGKTLDGIVDKLHKKFNVRRFIFVADRGLFSSKNLDYIRDSDGEFIVGLKMATLEENIQDNLYDISRFVFLSDELAIMETTLDGDRCIVTWSKSRAERDRKTREDILGKIRQKIGSKKVSSKKFISNTNYQKYVLVYDDKPPVLNQTAIDAQVRKDGFFGIISNVSARQMSAGELVANYKQLWKIEDAFGEIKGPLKARPIFHWTDSRIMGHLTLCFMAYLCEAHLTKALREKKSMLKAKSIEKGILLHRPLTAIQALDDLNSVLAIPVKIKNHCVWVRTDIPPNALELLRAMSMKIPPKILMQKSEM